MPRAVSIIQIFLSLLLVSVVAVSCVKSSPTSSTSLSASSNSTYPANISGQVIIPEYLYAGKTLIWKNAGGSNVFWVVEIDIENISYGHDITYYYDDYKNWQIVSGNETYSLEEGLMRSLHYKTPPNQDDWEIPKGQSGKITVCFSIPDRINVNDAALCYRGQEPYSYGKLTGGELVEVYDWNLGMITQLRNCVME